MVRSVETVEQPTDVIEIDPSAQTHPAGFHAKRRRPPNRSRWIESGPDRIIYHSLEWTPRSPRRVTQADHDVVFEGEGRAFGHVMKRTIQAS